MKKLLLLAFVGALVACGGEATPDDNNVDTPAVTTTVEQALDSAAAALDSAANAVDSAAKVVADSLKQ